MTPDTKADDVDGSNDEHAVATDVALGDIIADTKDIRNAIAFAERSAEGRVGLELDHAIEDLSVAVKRLGRAQDATDVGGDSATDAFAKGDRAFINEQGGDEVIILDTPEVRAKDYVVPGTSETVADYNGERPECSPNDPIVQAVFVEKVEAAFGSQWTDESILELFDDGLLADHASHYAYPDSRLTTENPEN